MVESNAWKNRVLATRRRVDGALRPVMGFSPSALSKDKAYKNGSKDLCLPSSVVSQTRQVCAHNAAWIYRLHKLNQTVLIHIDFWS